MNAFYVLGGLLGLWALLVSALGIMRHDFPRGRGGERVVIAVSALLVALAVGAAVVTAGHEEEGHSPEPGPEAVEPRGLNPDGR